MFHHQDQIVYLLLFLEYIMYDLMHLDLYQEKHNNFHLHKSYMMVFSPRIIFVKIDAIILKFQRISNLTLPFGIDISAVSPTFLPSRPFPIGESTEIFPLARSASHFEQLIYTPL